MFLSHARRTVIEWIFVFAATSLTDEALADSRNERHTSCYWFLLRTKHVTTKLPVTQYQVLEKLGYTWTRLMTSDICLQKTVNPHTSQVAECSFIYARHNIAHNWSSDTIAAFDGIFRCGPPNQSYERIANSWTQCHTCRTPHCATASLTDTLWCRVLVLWLHARQILLTDYYLMMVDGRFFGDSFEQDRSWDDSGTTISGI